HGRTQRLPAQVRPWPSPRTLGACVVLSHFPHKLLGPDSNCSGGLLMHSQKLVVSLLAASTAFVVSFGPVSAEYGGQGPIKPYNPFIKAEHASKAPTKSDAYNEAYGGHLSTNPHQINWGDGTRVGDRGHQTHAEAGAPAPAPAPSHQ